MALDAFQPPMSGPIVQDPLDIKSFELILLQRRIVALLEARLNDRNYVELLPTDVGSLMLLAASLLDTVRAVAAAGGLPMDEVLADLKRAR